MRVCKCHNCNANLEFMEDDRDFMFCQYCGAKVMLDDYRTSHTQRIVDEAIIKQAETDRIIKLKELEIQEERRKQGSLLRKVITVIWLIAVLAIATGCVYSFLKGNEINAMFYGLYVGLPVLIGGGWFIFKFLHEREMESMIAKGGGIRFPKLSDDSAINYEVLSQQLYALGFTNISCINLHDIKLGLLARSNMVEDITVNGKRGDPSGKWYPSDSRIIITYHGK